MQLGSGNGTSFPTTVDTATTEVNAPASGKTKARAEVVNDLLSAVIAIETALTDSTIDSWTTKYPSVQSVATGSRAVGTIYRNTTGRPMYVEVSAQSSAVVTWGIYTDSAANPTTVIGQVSQAANYSTLITFWVLPNNYYKVTSNAGVVTLSYWTETY